MKVRYLVKRDLSRKLSFEAKNPKELKQGLIKLAKSKKQTEVKLYDVFCVLYRGEEAQNLMKKWFRTQIISNIFNPYVLQKGLKEQYNGGLFNGKGTHMEIKRLLIFLSNNEINLFTFEEALKHIK